MKDDLAVILESIRNTQANIMARLARLERGQDVGGANELVVPGGYGFTSPTSPPSDRILIRRGFTWVDDVEFFDDFYMMGWSDFQPTLPISAFTDAYYYRTVIPFIDLDQSNPYDGFDVWEEDTDFAAFEDAVEYFMDDVTSSLVYVGWEAGGNPVFPFCALMIRNDGTTGAVNHYLPITLTDRSQSSFLIRDLRPWFTASRSS